MVIKAIPTKYNGIKFRSKLESEWAKWLDSQEIKWFYEVQGFDLEDGTWYLPDFFLPEIDTIIEVKGAIENIDKPYKLYQKLIKEYRLYKAEEIKKQQIKSKPEDWDYEFLKTLLNPENKEEFDNQCGWPMDYSTMLLLAGPVPHLYDIDSSYSAGFYTNKCPDCGKISIVTKLGVYRCRSCGKQSNGGNINGIELPTLKKPLRWQFLERD